MKELIRNNWIELVLITLTFISLFIHVIPPVLFATLCLLIMFLRLDVLGIILICIYAAPKLAGAIFHIYQLPGIGGALIVLPPLLIIYKCFITRDLKFETSRNVFPAFLLFFSYLLISVVIWGNSWSTIKLLYTVINGVIALLAYVTIFSNYKECNFIKTGLYFFLCAFLLLLLSPLFNHGLGPRGLLDFAYLRQQNGEWGDMEVSGIIAYQQVGFIAVLGLGTFMLEELKGNINTMFIFLALLLSTFAALYAGARQFFIIAIFNVIIWAFFGKSNIMSLKIWLSLLSIIITLLLINILFSADGLMNNVLTDGYLEASLREEHIKQGMQDFSNHPFVGIGYGCFTLDGDFGGYPHNLIVEILAELGIVGLILFWGPLLLPLKYIITKVKPCSYLMIVYFLRSMASGGLDTNIFLFSFIIASYAVFTSSSTQFVNNQKK